MITLAGINPVEISVEKMTGIIYNRGIRKCGVWLENTTAIAGLSCAKKES